MRLTPILIPLLLAGCVAGSLKKTTSEQTKVEAAAHRAYHTGAHSENSIEAIKESVEKEIPLIEIDIRESTDGLLFLFHDRVIQATSIREPKSLIGRDITSLSTKEVESIILPKGERVAKFNNAVPLVIRSKSGLLLDVKEGPEVVDRMLSFIKENGRDGSYWFLCYDEACIRQTKDKMPQASFIARVDDELPLDNAIQLDSKIIQIDCEPQCKTETAKINSKLPKTKILSKSLEELDNEKFWNFLKSEGITIILTDKPLELMKWADTPPTKVE